MPSTNTLRLAYLCAIFIALVVIVGVILMPYLPQVGVEDEPKLEKLVMSRSDDTDKPLSHVIVVGGGLAGLSAAIEAQRHGSRVTIIEKEKNLGGNSAKATSGINGVGTEAQRAMGIGDSQEIFIKDTITSGDGLSLLHLVDILAHNSAEAHVFLRSFGLNLTDVVQLGGHSVRRTHRIPPTPEGKPIPVGFTILNTLKKHIENELKHFVFPLTNTVFKKLLKEEGKVIGVQYSDTDGKNVDLLGTVVLTAGGFANDHTSDSLLMKYAPKLASLPTTNGPWATGDIIKSTYDQHLSLVHMDKVQVHPTGFIEPKQPNFHTKFLAPEALRGCGALLLNAEGKRFVNELGRRNYVSDNIFEKGFHFDGNSENPPVATMLLTERVIDKFGPPSVGFYKFKGLVQDVTNLEGAAEKLKISVDVLKETIKSYTAASEKGEDEFGKKAFPMAFSEDDHYYIAYITPTLHYCMGGIQIDVHANALIEKTDGSTEPLSGLFAAGEVSGGVHGANRLGGNSLLECVVFGRIAGQNAAHFKL